jgi:hypothetical protein
VKALPVRGKSTTGVAWGNPRWSVVTQRNIFNGLFFLIMCDNKGKKKTGIYEN